MTTSTPQTVTTGLPEMDWFLPAIETRGTLGQAFAAVNHSLALKLHLVETLQHQLCHNSGRLDHVSDLKNQVKKLEGTLTFRLGMLSPDRPGGWFRQNMNQGTGPFGSPILSEPILGPYETKKIVTLKFLLKKSYKNGEILDLPFTKKTPCLWLTLLSLNHRWHQISQVAGPWGSFDLATYNATSLPTTVASPALHTFLVRVQKALTEIRHELDECYRVLWQACEAFWKHQLQAPHGNPTRGQPGSGGASQHKRAHATVGDQRIQSALRLMNLSQLPSARDLKKRYHELARRWHPDVKGGSEARFNQLTASYQTLLREL